MGRKWVSVFFVMENHSRTLTLFISKGGKEIGSFRNITMVFVLKLVLATFVPNILVIVTHFAGTKNTLRSSCFMVKNSDNIYPNQ